jgi:hypothetical protein
VKDGNYLLILTYSTIYSLITVTLAENKVMSKSQSMTSIDAETVEKKKKTHRYKRSSNDEDLDDDEKAIRDEMGDSDDEESGGGKGSKRNTHLTTYSLTDVEKSLPPKTETILFTGLTATQRDLYKNILKRDIDIINSTSGSRTAILNIVMQLRKCCNHPYLFPNIEDRSLDPLGSHLYESCGKMLLLAKLLAKMKERGHRVLIFSQMTKMLDILEDFLISQGYLYCRIDGNTTYDEREDRISDYNAPNSSKFIFLLSTRAGGLGINLQTADTVIIYDRYLLIYSLTHLLTHPLIYSLIH